METATKGEQLNPEEARLKALELQKQVRAKVREKEKQAELEREKKRIQMGKELTEARRKIEETQTKLNLEHIQKTKKKQEEEKERMRKLIEADKKARFGDDYNKKKDKNNVKEEFNKIFNQMYKIYRYTDKNTLLSCMKTLNKYFSNILKNPNENKFRSIKQENKVFQNRIKNVVGGVNILTTVGFENENGFYVFNGDINDLQTIYNQIEQEISKMDNMM